MLCACGQIQISIFVFQPRHPENLDLHLDCWFNKYGKWVSLIEKRCGQLIQINYVGLKNKYRE